MKRLFKNRSFLSTFFAFILFFFVYLLSPLFYWINEGINTIFLTVKNYWNRVKSQMVNEAISIVMIDEKTLEKLGSFPISREYYKTLIESLNKWWAAVIGFDIIFADKNKDHIQSDRNFAKAIKNAWNVILWGSIITKEIWWKANRIIEKPIDILDESKFAFWYFTPILSKTWVVLSFIPTANLSDKDWAISKYNHFAISLLKAYYSRLYNKDFMEDYNKQKDPNYFYLRPDYPIPFSKTWWNEVLINYIPLPSNSSGKISNFETYSFVDVIEWKIDLKLFDWKIVLVWVTAKWIKDTFYTRNGIEYWVFVHANILNTIMKKDFSFYFNENLEWFLIFLLIITSIYFSLSPSGFIIVIANLAISGIFLVIYPIVILTFFSYIFSHLFELFLALPISIAIWNAVKYVYESNNKVKLSKALSEYVSKAIVKEILSNSWDLKLDWDTRKLAIFFSDIEGFTSISEKFSPHELVSFLRNYLSYMSNIILDNNWFINKYEWDAIMALWWAFSDNEKDSYYACLSALKQQETLKELNSNWQKVWLPKIKVRIWLHTWQAIVWNIWAVWRKIEYTALWDSVNLASRLEWVNKFYWTFICVSEDIFEENKDFFEFRYLDKIRVKWKDNAIKIYELLSEKWNLTLKKEKIRTEFEKAILVYNSRDFISAKDLFENIYKKYNDSPSKTYFERCKYFMNNKPKSNDELIWNYETK